MEDADDGEPEAEADADGDGEDDENEDNEQDDNDEDDGDDAQESYSPRPSQSQTERSSMPDTDTNSDDKAIQLRNMNGIAPTSHPNPSLIRTSASPRQPSVPLLSADYYPLVRAEALTARLYDIVPTMAAPQGTSINAITATPDMRYWFSGGSDCYIRKYDGPATVNGKTLLTVAQRHPFVDSVVKAGALLSYWENEEPNSKSPGDESALSPVYSLAVHHEALWLLSGLESGCINLQSVRHDEGKRITSLQKHTSAVSVLSLARDEKSVLSGSWDKNIYDWDLNNGKIKRGFGGSGGQISAIEIRPASSLPVPEESGEIELPNGTMSSNNDAKPLPNGVLSNGVNGTSNGASAEADGTEDAPGSPADTETDSLFGGGGDSPLFGETEAPSGGNFGGDEDDEFSRAMNVPFDSHDHIDAEHDTTMGESGHADYESAPAPAIEPPEDTKPTEAINGTDAESTDILSNGLPHSEEIVKTPSTARADTQDAVATSESTFLAASFDGTILVWDRRQQNPTARIPSRTAGPWCMAACWSPDGNSIYAGRRNGTVEEFSLHKGLKNPERIFKFPAGSGSVSALKAMPNGRHLIW
jgi:transcriptional activator SPT8